MASTVLFKSKNSARRDWLGYWKFKDDLAVDLLRIADPERFIAGTIGGVSSEFVFENDSTCCSISRLARTTRGEIEKGFFEII